MNEIEGLVAHQAAGLLEHRLGDRHQSFDEYWIGKLAQAAFLCRPGRPRDKATITDVLAKPFFKGGLGAPPVATILTITALPVGKKTELEPHRRRSRVLFPIN